MKNFRGLSKNNSELNAVARKMCVYEETNKTRNQKESLRISKKNLSSQAEIPRLEFGKNLIVLLDKC